MYEHRPWDMLSANRQAERIGRKEFEVRIRSRLNAAVHWLSELIGYGQGGASELNSETHWQRHRDALRHIRRELVELSTARRRLEDQIERLLIRAQRAEDRACQAIIDGLDDQARFHLVRKRAAIRQMTMLATQRDQLLADEQQLLRRERVLALRLEAFRQRRRPVLARKAPSGVRLRPTSVTFERISPTDRENRQQAGESMRNRRSA